MGGDILYGLLLVILVAALTEIVAYTSAVIRDADAAVKRARELSERSTGHQVDDQELATPATDAHSEGGKP